MYSESCSESPFLVSGWSFGGQRKGFAMAFPIGIDCSPVFSAKCVCRIFPPVCRFFLHECVGRITFAT